MLAARQQRGQERGHLSDGRKTYVHCKTTEVKTGVSCLTVRKPMSTARQERGQDRGHLCDGTKTYVHCKTTESINHTSRSWDWTNNHANPTQHRHSQPHTTQAQSTTHNTGTVNPTQHRHSQPHTTQAQSTTHNTGTVNHTQHRHSQPHTTQAQSTTHSAGTVNHAIPAPHTVNHTSQSVTGSKTMPSTH